MRGFVRGSSSTKKSLLARIAVGLLAAGALIPVGAESSQATGAMDAHSSAITGSGKLTGLPITTMTTADALADIANMTVTTADADDGGGTGSGGSSGNETGGGGGGTGGNASDGGSGSGSDGLAFTGMPVLLIPGLLGGLVLLLVGTGLVTGDRLRTLRKANVATVDGPPDRGRGRPSSIERRSSGFSAESILDRRERISHDDQDGEGWPDDAA